MMTSRLFTLSLGLITLAVAGPARADFVIQTGNHPPLGETVQLVGDTTGSYTINGFTNQTDTPVLITSTTQLLVSPSNGQARVEALSGDLLGLSSISLGGGVSFDRLIFNLNGNAGTVVFTVNGFDADNNPESYTSGAFAVSGNGQNFFTISAINGERITSVGFSTPQGLDDVRQIRIGGISTGAVPEPASVAMLGLGAGVIGLVGAARRRRAADA